ncbi:MoaD/ThiS family protein [Micromonospora sp. NPDC047707]|uniref:MoaD/ThiS family protein n=1 Tax=unclassified Micromonospora TaxID=2617518 RepID=UPI0012B4F15F|nr:MoaD/ThiS family protein [Micromonospora sp. WMMC415]QGN46209.1 MoaD/ThiS family protein [Micromonospora sp. WMMC415]
MPDPRPAHDAPDRAAASTLTVRFFAGARAAAGRAEETASAGGSLDDLLSELADRHGERLATVLRAASFLVDGVTCHDRRAPLPAGATIDVLPPFAGG